MKRYKIHVFWLREKDLKDQYTGKKTYFLLKKYYYVPVFIRIYKLQIVVRINDWDSLKGLDEKLTNWEVKPKP